MVVFELKHNKLELVLQCLQLWGWFLGHQLLYLARKRKYPHWQKTKTKYKTHKMRIRSIILRLTLVGLHHSYWKGSVSGNSRMIAGYNGCYWNWACSQSSFGWKLHTDKSNEAIQYNTKWPISLVHVLKPLRNVIRAIKPRGTSHVNFPQRSFPPLSSVQRCISRLHNKKPQLLNGRGWGWGWGGPKL